VAAIRRKQLTAWFAFGSLLYAANGCSSKHEDPEADPLPITPAARCGNGTVEAELNEVCDDGRNEGGDGGCLPGCKALDKSATFFARPLIALELSLPASEWDALRRQYKSRHSVFGTGDCRAHPIPNPYTYFSTDLTIDGVRYGRVGIRKKGHIGSQSTRKPSLKIDLAQFIIDQQHDGVERFAINNSITDPSYQRTCLAYRVFAAAGVPAPRCTYANVKVNGTALGLYVLIEEVKKPFLRRHFSEDSGNLYEGTACDFRSDALGGFEQETNEESDPSRADLKAVYNIVQTGTAPDFEAELDRVLNIKSFFRFWATEVLVWHRDGYGGNANNYFIYASPADGKRFHFIPWGPDNAFREELREDMPHSVLAAGVIPYYLYATSKSRERYYATLDELLANVWRPAELVATIDNTSALLREHLSDIEKGSFESNVSDLKTWVSARSADIAAARASGNPDWVRGIRDLPCRQPLGQISATFVTKWGTYGSSAFSSGTGSVMLQLDGKAVTTSRVGSHSGVTPGQPARLQLVADTTDQRRLTITTTFPDQRYFDPFLTVGTHLLTTPPVTTTLLETDISQTPARRLRSFEIGEGTWTFTKVGETDGAAVEGHFEGTYYQQAD